MSRPILRYFGGKWKIAPWIIENMPAHRIYVEPYGRGASVLLRKPRVFAEIYNDLDGEIVNVFRVMRDSSADLIRLLEWTPFSREEFNLAHEPSDSPIEQARRTIIRSFMGHGADSLTRKHKSGFRANANHENQGRNSSNDWTNYSPALPEIRDRLGGVIIENKDALEVMQQQDCKETLHFVDPPYLHETRTSTKHGYRHEMTNEDHQNLCDFLKTLDGMVMLCSYKNEIYDKLNWNYIERKTFADGGNERTEIIYFNKAAMNGNSQLKFNINNL